VLILVTDFKQKPHCNTVEYRSNTDVSLQIGIFQFMDKIFE